MLGRNRSQKMVRPSGSISAKMQLLFDILVVEGLLFLFIYLKGIQDFSLYYYPASIAPLLMWLIYSNSGVFRRFAGNVERALNVLRAWSKVASVMIVWAFVTKDSHEFSRQVILSWFVAAGLLQMANHIIINYVLRLYLAKHRETIPSLLVGNSKLGGYLTEHINNNPWTAHKIVGVINDFYPHETWHVIGLPHLGVMSELHAMVEKYKIRRVYFLYPWILHIRFVICN